MAKQVHVILVDDIDGSSDARTVEFSLGRDAYTIDLSEKNASKLEAAPPPTRQRATRRGRTAARKRAGRPGSRDTNAIREWARANDVQVSDRGRIPAQVLAAYEAAH